ncbi:hypothetical protein DL764_003972 [Monosporascus ibericus]|uniref:Uncharacterized protein n=1 Tax=Monosporascus ibericus TaxID=155417 RepID=A0A4Q4TGA9_9PEZI|nr:hypothetical protein DL764_003972 [Monosporascus ibericus]
MCLHKKLPMSLIEVVVIERWASPVPEYPRPAPPARLRKIEDHTGSLRGPGRWFSQDSRLRCELTLDIIQKIILELPAAGDIMSFAAVYRTARAVVLACINFNSSDNVSALRHGMRSLRGKRVYTKGLPNEYEVPSMHDPKYAPSGG